MSRRPSPITEAYLRKVLKVAEEKGLTVEVKPDGTVTFRPQTVVDEPGFVDVRL